MSNYFSEAAVQNRAAYGLLVGALAGLGCAQIANYTENKDKKSQQPLMDALVRAIGGSMAVSFCGGLCGTFIGGCWPFSGIAIIPSVIVVAIARR